MKIIKQSVSADISKDKFDACFSVLTSVHQVVVKATHKFANSASGLAAFSKWISKWEDPLVDLVVILAWRSEPLFKVSAEQTKAQQQKNEACR